MNESDEELMARSIFNIETFCADLIETYCGDYGDFVAKALEPKPEPKVVWIHTKRVDE